MLGEMFVRGGLHPSEAQAGVLSIIFGIVAKQARLQAINDTMIVLTIITLSVILPALLLKKSKQTNNVVKPVITE